MMISSSGPLTSFQRSVQHLVRRFHASPAARLGIEVEGKNIRAVGLKKRESGVLELVGCTSFAADLWGSDIAARRGFGDGVRKISKGIVQSAFSIEHPTLRIRRMSVAPMPEADLLEAIRWNFREHVDCPMEKYAVGYTRIQSMQEEHRMLLMGFGISEDALREHAQLAKDMGFKAVAVEPAATALLAAFHLNGILKENKTVVSLCLEESVAYFVVFTDHELLFSRPLSGVSMDGFMKMVARNGGLELPAAEEAVFSWLARSFAEKAGEGNPLLDTVEVTASHFLSQLVIEVQRSIDAFCIMYDVEAIPEIYLCGAGVLLPNLTMHVEHSLGVAARIFDPFQTLVLPQEMREMPTVERSSYSIATGLALP